MLGPQQTNEQIRRRDRRGFSVINATPQEAQPAPTAEELNAQIATMKFHEKYVELSPEAIRLADAYRTQVNKAMQMLTVTPRTTANHGRARGLMREAEGLKRLLLLELQWPVGLEAVK